MAGDWIKVEHAMPDKPEVVSMAAALGIDQDAVSGKLLRLWIWADQQSRNGHDINVTESFLDRLVYCPGFAVALRGVGWLQGRDGRLVIPNFCRHNGQTAKNRALAGDRKKKERAQKDQPVTEVSRSKRDKRVTREENRRDSTNSKEITTKVVTKKKAKKAPKIDRAKAKGSIDEIKAYCVSQGLPESDGEAMFYKWEANGWTNGGKPIKDWRLTIKSWERAGYMPSQKGLSSNHGNQGSQANYLGQSTRRVNNDW